MWYFLTKNILVISFDPNIYRPLLATKIIIKFFERNIYTYKNYKTNWWTQIHQKLLNTKWSSYNVLKVENFFLKLCPLINSTMDIILNFKKYIFILLSLTILKHYLVNMIILLVSHSRPNQIRWLNGILPWCLWCRPRRSCRCRTRRPRWPRLAEAREAADTWANRPVSSRCL